MPTRAFPKSATQGLEKSERDFLLITVADAVDRMSEQACRIIGKSIVRQMEERHGILAGWRDLPEERQTHAAALELLRSIPALIRANKPRRRGNALSRRMDWLAVIFGLDRVERDGLGFVDKGYPEFD